MKTSISQPKIGFRSRRKRSSGQALIEYILVVTVTVIIVATLVQRMFRPMDNFVRNMMGTYVACLLETGELPGLGANLDGEGSQCNIDLFADGYTAPDPETGKDDEENEDDMDKLHDRSASNRGGGGGGVRMGPRGTFTVGGGKKRGTAGAEKIVIQGDEGSAVRMAGGGDYWGSSGGRFGSQQRNRYIAIRGELAEQALKLEKKEKKGKITTPRIDGGFASGSSKKVSLKPPEKRTREAAEVEIATLDISDIVKYLLIAAIILIMIILIGGQVAQISKSWEKGE